MMKAKFLRVLVAPWEGRLVFQMKVLSPKQFLLLSYQEGRR